MPAGGGGGSGGMTLATRHTCKSEDTLGEVILSSHQWVQTQAAGLGGRHLKH